MPQPLIMVVEDDPVLRNLAALQLSKLGCESLLLDCGEAAVEACHEKIQLIFMDIGLPGIDGTHAAILIRERELAEDRKRVPIVALTAHSNRDKAFAAGMDDFLQKPALLADIKNILEKWIIAK